MSDRLPSCIFRRAAVPAGTRSRGQPAKFQDRVALHTPEQRPDGPVPLHVPLPLRRPKRPAPCAVRGPVIAVMRVLPEAATRPLNFIGWNANAPPVA